MKLLSESIADYVDLNYDIDFFSDIKELDVVEELVINRYNYSLEDCSFYPEELSYFNCLKKCTFINFLITDEIVMLLNKMNLKEVVFDNCNCSFSIALQADKIFVEASEISFSNLLFHNLVVLENEKIDIAEICQNDISKLTILNTPIIHSSKLKEFNQTEIVIKGCILDDNSVKELDNVSYDDKRYERIA